jgi:alanyl-tRNA synthetase
MTRRLYYDDSYLTQFDAAVTGSDADGRRVYLDKTAFYPTSGGQQFDTGWLEVPGPAGPVRRRVIDVVDEGDRIAHVLEPVSAAPLAPGLRLSGQIDWPRRFDHMQQHTGQHLLSAVFQDLLGHATVSVHFGVESSTLDLDTGALSAEQAQNVEQRANASVFANRPVTSSLEEASAAEGLRKASARSGPLRIISIDALDRSACGGTHVQRTGEIGPILLRKLDRVRKAVRVEFVCGGRATARARADYAALSSLGRLLSTGLDEVVPNVTARLAELEQQGALLRDANERLDEYRARELYGHAAETATQGGIICSIERRTSGTLQDVRGLAQRYTALPRGVFIAALETPPSLLVAAAEDSGIDAGALLKTLFSTLGGRGGGSARLAQGSLESTSALNAVLAGVHERLGVRDTPPDA